MDYTDDITAGEKSERVEALQDALGAAGFPASDAVRGHYDRPTMAAVENFHRANGHPADVSRIGIRTARALGLAPPPALDSDTVDEPPDEPPAKAHHKGHKGHKGHK